MGSWYFSMRYYIWFEVWDESCDFKATRDFFSRVGLLKVA